MKNITAMTTLCVDVFDSTGEIVPGGEALNFAAAACGYPHVRVGIMGAVGDDGYGKAVLSSIKDMPIGKGSIHVIKGGRTASHRIYLTQDGDRYFKEDSWYGGVYESFELSDEDIGVIKGSDAVFITYDSPNFDEVLRLKKSCGFKFAVDFNVERELERLFPIIPYIDFFFISGEDGILPTFRAWSERFGGIFNITLGERGSVTFYKGMEYKTGAVPVERVVDTTGCGDSYHAGFMCSCLKDGDIIRAMSEGARKASITLSHIGGF